MGTQPAKQLAILVGAPSGRSVVIEVTFGATSARHVLEWVSPAQEGSPGGGGGGVCVCGGGGGGAGEAGGGGLCFRVEHGRSISKTLVMSESPSILDYPVRQSISVLVLMAQSHLCVSRRKSGQGSPNSGATTGKLSRPK